MVCLGNLWSFLNEVKPHVVFDEEHRMALELMQGIWPHLMVRGDISWFFSNCGGNLGFPLE